MSSTMLYYPDLFPAIETDPNFAANYPWVGCVDRMMTKNVPHEFLPFSTYIARRISSTLNRDFRMMFVGQPGSGKSWAALYLAEKIAENLATIHNRPASDFFSAKNVIYGTPDEVQESLRTLKKYNVYVLDDIGVSANSREFASYINKWFSNVFQTCRTDNVALLLTLPDMFLVDKVPRSLMYYLAEMQPTPKTTYYSNTTFAKIFQITKNYRMNKQYYIYIRAGHKIYSQFKFMKPSDHLLESYEGLRQQVAKKAKFLTAKSPTSRKKMTKTTKTNLVDAIFEICLSQNCSVREATKIYNSRTNSDVPYRPIYQKMYQSDKATKKQRQQLRMEAENFIGSEDSQG